MPRTFLMLSGSWLICLCLFPVATQAAPHLGFAKSKDGSPLTPKMKVGDRFGDLFSRTIASRVPGYDDIVGRASGNADYTTTAASATSFRFATQGRYDGSPDFSGTTEIRDHGATSCWKEQCSPNLDGSGLLYNPLLWGQPPASLRQGMAWDISIAQPWELGPPGKQHVTVLALDRAHHQVTLQREGAGTGFFDSDAHQLSLKKGDRKWPVDVTPGQAHWIGRTTFQDGVILSDELLVERPLILTSKELGTVQGTQRQFILLNATPRPNG